MGTWDCPLEVGWRLETSLATDCWNKFQMLPRTADLGILRRNSPGNNTTWQGQKVLNVASGSRKTDRNGREPAFRGDHLLPHSDPHRSLVGRINSARGDCYVERVPVALDGERQGLTQIITRNCDQLVVIADAGPAGS